MNPAAFPYLLPRAALALLVAALAPTVAADQVMVRFQWQPQDSQQGCQIATSAVAGKDYLAAKAVCVIDAPADDVGQVLRDIPRYPEWMQGCSATTMLRVVDRDKDIYIFWYRQHIPLFSDRDAVLKSEVTLGRKDGRRWASIVATTTGEAAYDAGEGFVRMPSFVSEWRLEEIDATHTKVSFMISPDLGGGLPVGLSNSRIAESPFLSIQGLKKQLRKRERPDKDSVASTPQ